MTITATDSPATTASPCGPRWLRQLTAVPEARWATVSLVLFAAAGVTQLVGLPAWTWGPLYAGCYLAGGWEPAVEGLRALRGWTLDVDLLMIVAALGAAAIGQVFEGALLVVIFATSGALEAWATARTEDSVRGLLDLTPDQVNRVEGDGEVLVATAELVVDDVIVVRPGQSVGADGVVVDGGSDVDQASITGEPLPVAKTVGDEVFAGTLNGTGALRVRVTREAADSVLARIASLVEHAARTKARTQLFIEKVEQRYSVTVVVATIAVFALPLLLGGEHLTRALLRAMTFMIVASPCAVVLATMPPLLAAIANAGRHGVLVKSALVMEQLGTITMVTLDKTGTLTRGTPELADIHLLTQNTRRDTDTGWAADTVLAAAAAAEHGSEHPLARAVVAAAVDRDLPVATATDFSSTPGRGVTARVHGRSITVGSPAHLLGPHPDAPAHRPAGSRADIEARAVIDHVEGAGHTAVLVLDDDRPVAVLAVTDQLRPEAAATVAALTTHTGTPPILLTGDNPRTAAGAGAAVGIRDVRAELLPQDKVAAIDDLRRDGHQVLAVGDGVNDAPALAKADVGAAMGHRGADLTLHAAGVIIVRDELDTLPALPALLDLARRARRTIIANLVIAATIITALVTWDLAGDLPLPLGVAGHEGSTVLVGLNGLRLLHHGRWNRRHQRPGPSDDQ